MDLLIATTNPGKATEIEALLGDLPLRVVSLRSLDSWPEVAEDGATFEENAVKKARVLASFSGLVTLADDSGLEVDVLHGAPGVLSARYSGPKSDDARNNEKLLRKLRSVPREKRGARFVCVLAWCGPSRGREEVRLFRGECRGWIALSPRGDNGFGYDPLFVYPPFDKTFGEMEPKMKSAVSHRGQAVKRLRDVWHTLFPGEIHS